MPDWLEEARRITKALPSEGLRTSPVGSESAETGSIPLDCLIGPSELRSRFGIPRGSVAYMRSHHGMPAPVLQLDGIRLWDARAIEAWQASRTKTD